MSVLEQFGRFVADYDIKSLSPELQQAIRLHVADVTAGWIAAIGTGEGRALIALRAKAGQAGRVGGDLLVNCALARLSEIDDIHLASMTTAGGIVVPAAVTIAGSQPQIDGGDLAASIVAGYEVMVRVGLAIDGPTVLYRGIWPTYFTAPCGVAAVAARLLGLDAQKTAHALALALTFGAPGVGHHNAPTTSRWFAVGNAARNGYAAALAVQAGFTADVHVLDSAFFKTVYGIEPDLAKSMHGLGEAPVVADVSFKPWCAARQTMAAVQAFREILADGVAANEIEAIEVAVLPPHQKMLDHGVVAGDRASYLTSLPYQLAATALTPAALHQVGYANLPASAALEGLMARIGLCADPHLLADYPAVWPARVVVNTSKGKQERLVRHVPGDPERPLDDSALNAKFIRFVSPMVGSERAANLWEIARESVDGHQQAKRLVQEIGLIAV